MIVGGAEGTSKTQDSSEADRKFAASTQNIANAGM